MEFSRSLCSWNNLLGLSILNTPPRFASCLVLSRPQASSKGLVWLLFQYGLLCSTNDPYFFFFWFHSMYGTILLLCYVDVLMILFSLGAIPHSCHPSFIKSALSLPWKIWVLHTTSLALKCPIHHTTCTSLKNNVLETYSNMKCSPLWLPKPVLAQSQNHS